MRLMRTRWFCVLAAVFALLTAGSVVSGCDNGKPSQENQSEG